MADRRRIVIVAGPRCGKSTLARQLRAEGYPTLCGDPASLAKDLEAGVEYLPEGLEWSEGSAFVARDWFARPGPWVAEGQIMARALRKASADFMPDEVRVILNHHPAAAVTEGQARMAQGVRTVWAEIAPRFAAVATLWAWTADGVMERRP